MTVEATNLGAPVVGADEMLSFDYFIAASKIQMNYITRYTSLKMKDIAEKRRLLLKEENK